MAFYSRGSTQIIRKNIKKMMPNTIQFAAPKISKGSIRRKKFAGSLQKLCNAPMNMNAIGRVKLANNRYIPTMLSIVDPPGSDIFGRTHLWKGMKTEGIPKAINAQGQRGYRFRSVEDNSWTAHRRYSIRYQMSSAEDKVRALRASYSP